MPLLSKALPRNVLLSEALSVMALPLAGPNHLLEALTEGSFRLLASPCVSFHPHHPLSHVTEVSQVVQERAEGPKAPSPGHRPGYNSNQQGAL